MTPWILSIETATNVCSVALHKDGYTMANVSLFIEKSHSGYLISCIHDLLAYCKIKINDLNALAISKGPGSYTGLRIGTSTAKGLCYALDIPLIAINTLKAMAYDVSRINKEHLLCPMIDARRMEVYSMLLDNELNLLQNTKAIIIDENSYRDELDKQKILFFGNGAAKCQNIIVHENAVFFDSIFPDAVNIGFLAHQKFLKQEFEDLAYFEPFYLKDFMITKQKLL